jgi:16S rRNA (cytidine1402-2'-O)-methyltransferase
MARGPTLSVVATPIGNLEDLSLRAARVLATAQLIAAEDTRSAHVLLRAVDSLATMARTGAMTQHGANEPLEPSSRRVISLFDGNEAERSAEVIAAIDAGQRVALISEAGTPLVSDPGGRLVHTAIAHGITIEVIPGPNAAIAALVASGISAERFLFLGFPPREPGARQQLFGTLRNEPATMLLYEAPDRVGRTFADLAAAFGPDRRGSLSRELTKMYEEHVRGTLAELAQRYADEAPRGECTLVIEGGQAQAVEVDIEQQLRALLAQGLGPKDAAARLMVVTGKPRRQLYQLALSLARGTADE